MDSKHLLSLAGQKTPQSQAELALIIEDMFEDHDLVLSDRERHLMFNIIKKLVHEVEVSIRKKLSEKLSVLEGVPHDLAMKLATDDIEVAYPILAKSKAIRDDDLIELIHLRTEEYHLAISLRDDLVENVTDVLVEVGSNDVIESLLKNKDAKISQATMGFLVEQSRRVDTFQEPLIHRQELTETLATKMFSWVSNALRQDIAGRYKLNDETIDKLLKESAAEELAALSSGGYKVSEDTLKLLDKLKRAEMITQKVLIDVLVEGEIALFIAIFCEMSQLDELLAKKILFEDSGEGLAIVCRALDIPVLSFSTIYSKTRKVAPDRPRATRNDINRMFDLYQDLDVDDARRALTKLQENSDYLPPIREIFPHV